MAVQESIKWWPTVRVLKYGPETLATITKDIGHEPSGNDLRYLENKYGLTPDEITVCEGNALTTAGRDRIVDLICGSGTAFTWNATASLTRGYAGVGTSTTAFAAGQTALVGTARYNLIDASPTSVDGVISANTTYTSGEAEFAWEEWCWGISTGTITEGATVPTGVMLNRKVQSLGTKGAGSTWTLQATVTIT